MSFLSEPVTVGYDSDSYVTTETDGSVTLTIRVFSHPAGAPRPFTLVVNTEDGTASMLTNYKANALHVLCTYFQCSCCWRWLWTSELARSYNSMQEMSLKPHTITINNDDVCEIEPANENFFSNTCPGQWYSWHHCDYTTSHGHHWRHCSSQSVVSIVFTGGKNNDSNVCSLLPEPITVGYDPDSYVTTETAGSVTLNIRVFSHPAGAPRPFTLVVNTEDGTASMFLARVILHVYHIFLIQLLLMVTMYQWLVRSYSSTQEMSLGPTPLLSMMIMSVKRIQMKISSPTLPWTVVFLISLWLCLELWSPLMTLPSQSVVRQLIKWRSDSMCLTYTRANHCWLWSWFICDNWNWWKCNPQH